jgi:hypothetical protein
VYFIIFVISSRFPLYDFKIHETIKTTNPIISYLTLQKIYNKSFLGEYNKINLQVGKYRRGYYLLEVDHNQRIGTLKFIKE